MKHSFFKLAKKAASAGQHRQHQIGAVISKKGKIINIGFNRQKTHPKSPSPYKHIHAELDCILGIDDNVLDGAEIYVYRQTKNGTLGNAKPCIHCEWLLRLKRLKKVHYTSETGYKTYALR